MTSQDAGANWWGLFVGVSHYQEVGLTSLPGASEDARRVYEFYRGLSRINSERLIPCYESTNPGVTSPRYQDIRREIEEIKSQVQRGATLIFFYSGHGFQVEGEHFLLANDTVYDRRIRDVIGFKATAISVPRLRHEFEQSGFTSMIFIVDACREQPLVARGGSSFSTGLKEEHRENTPKGWAILAACDEGQVSYENTRAKEGIFTRSLLRCVEPRAATGVLKLSEVQRCVHVTVPQVIREALTTGGAPRADAWTQEPRLIQDVNQDLDLIPPFPVEIAPRRVERFGRLRALLTVLRRTGFKVTIGVILLVALVWILLRKPVTNAHLNVLEEFSNTEQTGACPQSCLWDSDSTGTEPRVARFRCSGATGRCQMCITSHPIATADQKGYDLTPYSRISFQAKADREVMVEFYVGGKPQQGKTYFDSFQLPAREIQLDREWKEITLNFGNEDRTSIIHLLCWSVAVDKSAPIEVEMKEILLE